MGALTHKSGYANTQFYMGTHLLVCDSAVVRVLSSETNQGLGVQTLAEASQAHPVGNG